MEGHRVGKSARDRSLTGWLLPIDRDEPEDHRCAPEDTHRTVRRGQKIPPDAAIPVRVVEYEVPDREGNGTGELICVITSILDPDDVTAIELATAYHQRWESETSFQEKKTYLRRSGRVLRSKSPAMVRQEIWEAYRKLSLKKCSERIALKAVR